MRITQVPTPPTSTNRLRTYHSPPPDPPQHDSLLRDCGDRLALGLYRAVPVLIPTVVGAAGLGMQSACWGALVGRPLLGASIGAAIGGLGGLAVGLVYQSLSEMD